MEEEDSEEPEQTPATPVAVSSSSGEEASEVADEPVEDVPDPANLQMVVWQAPTPQPEEPPQERHYWQVKKGKVGRMRWGWCSEDLSDHLEQCFLDGVLQTSFDVEGSLYDYDLQAMTQTSQEANRPVRGIRRVVVEEEDWA